MDAKQDLSKSLSVNGATEELVSQEILEDRARRDYDVALQLMSEGKHFEAKKQFEKVVNADLPDTGTPFRAKLFRAAWKNLARCHLVFEDSRSVVHALVQAASFLEKDEHDVSLYLMLRRAARDTHNAPLFRMVDATLQEITPPDDYVALPFEDEGVQHNVETETIPNIPASLTIMFPKLQELTWNDFFECLKRVDVSEHVTLLWKGNHQEDSFENDDTNEDACMPVEPETFGAVEVIPQLGSENQSSTIVPPQNPMEETSSDIPQSHPISPTDQTSPPRNRKKSRKIGETAIRLTKRQQIIRSQSVEDAPPQPPIEISEDEVNPEELLPPLDAQRWQELSTWFESRTSEDAASDLRVSTMAHSPVVSRTASFTAEQEKEQLRNIVIELSARGEMTGYNLLRATYDLVCKSWSLIPVSAIADIYDMLVTVGVELSQDEKWLGTLCELEADDPLPSLTPTQVKDVDEDAPRELFVLERALTSDNYDLASRTLVRCVNRSRLMKRPLLTKLALDRLEEFQHPEDNAFIVHERDRLMKSSTHEKIDAVLEECAIGTSMFKKLDHCLRRVREVCEEEGRPGIFARYRMDVLKHGVVNRYEHVCRTALFHFIEDDSSYTKTSTRELVLDKEEEKTSEAEGFRVTQLEVEVTFCRLAKLYPQLITRKVVEIAWKGLWQKLLPALWIWMSESPNEAASASEYVKAIPEEDYAGMDEVTYSCILHATFRAMGYRAALFALKQSKHSALDADWMRRRLELCDYLLEKDPTVAMDVFLLLLYDTTQIKFFQTAQDGSPVPSEGSSVSSDEESMVTIEDLETYREAVLYKCAKTMWKGSMFSHTDVPLMWEFLAPHLWASEESLGEEKFHEEDKKAFLEKLLPFVSVAPATELISKIEEGGVWYHLAMMNVHKTTEEAEKAEKAENNEGESWLERFMERDHKCEPNRLSTLFMIGNFKYHQNKLDECASYLEDIEKLVERRIPVPIKPGALVNVKGYTDQAIVARIYDVQLDDDDAMNQTDDGEALKNRKLVDLLFVNEEQHVKRGVPFEKIQVIPKSLMADVLPDQLDEFLIDVNDYLAVIRKLENNPILDQGVKRAIVLCERIEDERLWAYYWLMGLATEERDWFQRANDRAEELSTGQKKGKSSKSTAHKKSKGYAHKVAIAETRTRLLELELQEVAIDDLDEEKKRDYIKKLEKILEMNSSNICAARLLQELRGFAKLSLLEETLSKYMGKPWLTEVFVYDQMSLRMRDEEAGKTLDLFFKALKDHPSPMPTIHKILDLYRQKKLKSRQNDVYEFVAEYILARLDLENTFVVNLTMKHPSLKKKSDARLLELGQAEFKVNTLGEVLEECRTKWKNHTDQHRSSKLFKPANPTAVPSTAITAPTTTESADTSLVPHESLLPGGTAGDREPGGSEETRQAIPMELEGDVAD